MENYVPYERHPVEDCYHIYSDGTRVSVLFERDEDKVYGRNLIAILAFKYHIRVYCDVVMCTHFHLVGKGDPENIHRFVAEMKRLLTRYFRQTHRPELVKESIWIKADPILDDVELARKIIYVFRNPLDAGDPLLPENYPWGVGRLFFQQDTAVAAKRVGDMTLDERRTLFRTRSRFSCTAALPVQVPPRPTPRRPRRFRARRRAGATGLFTQNPADFAIKATHKSLIISKNKLKRLKTDKVPKFAHLCKNECA